MVRMAENIRSRKNMRPSSLTGQGFGVIDSVKAIVLQAKTKVNEKRPGAIIPKQTGSSLLSPGSMSIQHERVPPNKSYNSRMSFQYD